MNRRTFLKACGFITSILGGLIPLPTPAQRPSPCRLVVWAIDPPGGGLYKYTADYGYTWHEGTWPEFMSAVCIAAMTDWEGCYFEMPVHRKESQ